MLSVRRKLSSVWNGSLFSQQRYFTRSIIKREIWVSLLPKHLKRQSGTRPSANNLRRRHEIIAHQGTGATFIEFFTEPCVLYGKRNKNSVSYMESLISVIKRWRPNTVCCLKKREKLALKYIL